MSINVYWACLEEEWMRFSEPESVIKNFLNSESMKETSIHKCPSFRKSLQNTFSLKSIYEYEFKIIENSVQSSYYDQNFFDKHVLIRSIKEKTFSFNQWLCFFTDEKSLTMSSNIFPYLEDNNITERCLIPPGEFDIGKWFRNTEFTFKLKNNFNSFKIEEGEIYQYIKFYTNKKINFIEYRHDEKIKDMLEDVIKSRNFSNSKKTLQDYYSFFKIKKDILKEIKKNTI